MNQDKLSKACTGVNEATFDKDVNLLSVITKQFLGNAKDKIKELVKTVPVGDGTQSFNIGDYGCSDGTASASFIRDLILCLRNTHGGRLPINVFYDDRAVKYFDPLFKMLHGFSDTKSYLTEFSNVFAFATGANFYTQCVPDSSMNLIICFMAVHWLSRRPTVLRNSLYHHIDCTDEERHLVENQARADWETFLLTRSKELKHGAFLAVTTPTRYLGDDGKYTGTNEWLLRNMVGVWKRFAESGKITEEEFINTNFDGCSRTKEELICPFMGGDSDVTRSGLHLCSFEWLHPENRFYQVWQNTLAQTGVDDRESFARNLVSAFRVWSERWFSGGLSLTRSEEERAALVNDFYSELKSVIRHDSPNEYRFIGFIGLIIIQKL